MKITVLSHNLSSNAAMRAYRLAVAARTFAEVTLVGPAQRNGLWPALPREPWMHALRKRRLPRFAESFLELVELCTGDVLIAAKPQLASFGVALVAAERDRVPVVLDVDDLDVALAPREVWADNPLLADISRPGSAVYVALLTRATSAAAAVTAASRALAERFGGTVVPHGADTDTFDPGRVIRAAARERFGFSTTTVLFPGTPRDHKGVAELARAVAQLPSTALAVTCRPDDLSGPAWSDLPIVRVPIVPHTEMPKLLAAADVVAIPQLDTEASRYQMPMKVYDAMAMAKPIVATAISDLPELLDGCGVVVPTGDHGALVAGMRGLVEDPEGAAALGERARRRCVDAFGLDRVAALLHDVVSSVVSR